jgi:hypothetical protein
VIKDFEYLNEDGSVWSLVNYLLFQSDHSIFFEYLKKRKKEYLFLNEAGIQILENYTSFGKDSLTRQVISLLRNNEGKIPYMQDEVKVILKLDSILNSGLIRNPKASEYITRITNRYVTSNMMEDYFREIAILFAKSGFPESAAKFFDLHKRMHNTTIPTHVCMQLYNREGSENMMYYVNYMHDMKYRKKLPSSTAFYRILGRIGGKSIEDYALSMMRLESDILKAKANEQFITGIAETGRLYRAYTFISPYLSPDNKAAMKNKILHTEIMRRLRRNADNATQGEWNDTPYFEYFSPDSEIKNLNKKR